ncbi:ATP-grasp domain-containing protein [Mucilaginibacter myungsuensis]|uniref:ATP-grasp domain-containing protein n=1 Tax=Mucilaginibacter myungsuensis TaxID=649104 RepID=A0A929L7J2_9SPHI|nr:ATP-grasp domain-containing protein [Mucilaginibacter myungsuensis]MBE9664621.1 ATP-grasp domain-containing protein [Mucilaginibacter myungsuensis]MDN3601489.1 ATP-grasp domain-containing protein [Mucilaginibacter myungsuensis]
MLKNFADKPLVIGVTALNAIDSPGPGVAVIRALRDGFGDNIRVIGLSYESLEPGVYLHDLVDKTYQIPYPSAGAHALVDRLQYIHGIEHLDVIIPNFDAELYNFIKVSAQLRIMGIHTFLPTHEQLDARDKMNLSKFGEKYKLHVPEAITIYKADELRKAADELDYPLVVKGKYYEAFVCQTLEQAHKAFYQLSAKWGTPIIVQKFMKGTEINIAALGDGEGDCISIIPMRKLYITDKGKAWAGITIEDADLLDLARQFTKATNWRGGFELEIMRDADGKLFIMEVNPRFPAWIYLTAGAGQNQPEALVKLAMGEKVEAFSEYQVGKMFIRYAWDHITDVSEFQQLSAFGEL